MIDPIEKDSDALADIEQDRACVPRQTPEEVALKLAAYDEAVRRGQVEIRPGCSRPAPGE